PGRSAPRIDVFDTRRTSDRLRSAGAAIYRLHWRHDPHPAACRLRARVRRRHRSSLHNHRSARTLEFFLLVVAGNADSYRAPLNSVLAARALTLRPLSILDPVAHPDYAVRRLRLLFVDVNAYADGMLQFGS